MSKTLIKTGKSIITYTNTKNDKDTHYNYKSNNIICNHIIYFKLHKKTNLT